MRRRLLPALAVVLVAAALAGCGSQETTGPATATAAPPQQDRVNWVEPAPAEGDGLVFEVREIAVTPSGWRVDAVIRNRSPIPWGTPAGPLSSMGVMLFATGEMSELEQRNASQDLPGLRAARDVEPSLPARLGPGASWEGTISAPGSLAAGRWLRVVFGPFTADGDAPQGLPSPLVWITDNAYRLRR